MSRRTRLAITIALVATLVASAAGYGMASTFTPTVTIGSATAAADNSAVTVTGSARAKPPLVVDAGPSSYVEQGELATLIGSASLGRDPYSFAWSFEGSAARFASPNAFQTTFETAGLSGAVEVELSATDSAGVTETDSTKLFVFTITTQRVLDMTGTSTAPTPASAAAVVRHPFPVSVPTGRSIDSLDVVLSWTRSYRSPSAPSAGFNGVTLAGYNLRVEDPAGTDRSNGQGAEFTEPEDVHLAGPLPAGTWQAVVDPYLAAPDTYRVTAELTTRTPNPVPTLSTDGPWNYASSDVQRLRSTVTGGVGPFTTVWDLDFDGYFETPDTANGVTPNFTKGAHLVAAKTSDANGYEALQINTVRVDQPGAGPVVVAVTDTGVNPYHVDFRASTYPDAAFAVRTSQFTKHPSAYINGYPAGATAKQLTFDTAFAAGKLYPAADAALWTKTATPNGKLFWFPGTKVIGAVDASDTAPVNGEADATPLLDDDGHGTASASVAVGNIYGYCPTCLLFFAEGFAGDAIGYAYPWVDLASNSFGSAANVGFAGLFEASHPKAAAERGQIALYAAGNGNANAFESPEQTYTSENLGADWIVRVGAVDKRYRKPIVGTGKPVDISSWGQGAASGPTSLPAASNTSYNGATTHSGTSAATPYSAGVFGTVLGTIRKAIGDTDAGQKNLAPDDGAIARGNPLPDSPYLGDGVLTRAELVETVFKTAQHDAGSWSPNYPVTTPSQNPYQYMVEGYGIVEPASGNRAVDVLLGRAPLPVRAAEDAFFANDSALRDELWGGWNGGGVNSAQSSGSAPAVPPGRYTGVTASQVATWPSAFATLDRVGGPFQPPAVAPEVASGSSTAPANGGVGPLAATITTPSADSFVDRSKTPTFAVGGTYAFPANGSAALRTYPFWAEDTNGDCGEQKLVLAAPVADSGCMSLVQPAAPVGGAHAEVDDAISLVFGEGVFTETYSLGGRLPLTLAAGRVSGRLKYSGAIPDPMHTVEVRVVGTTGGAQVSLGSATVTFMPMVHLLGLEATDGAAPFGFDLPAQFAGRQFSAISLEVTTRLATLAWMDRNDGNSYLDLPIPAAQTVQISVDDPTFADPATAILSGDGRWGATVEGRWLADGQHKLYARAVQATTVSAPALVTFTLGIPTPPPPPPLVVEVQLVAPGGSVQPNGWRRATDTSGRGDFATWTANLPSGAASGAYEVHARLVQFGTVTAIDGPVVVQVNPGP